MRAFDSWDVSGASDSKNNAMVSQLQQAAPDFLHDEQTSRIDIDI